MKCLLSESGLLSVAHALKPGPAEAKRDSGRQGPLAEAEASKHAGEQGFSNRKPRKGDSIKLPVLPHPMTQDR